ncbi:MAG: spermidine synthase [Deltaproteobacteria bacterium HGW-Deltaproteobacteria-8]|jgi:spermidine synthase|nr:MAG: spermidine synthase [Deltaproteobacteria bacterium HGW-Deltaproteobacteria-8]
MLELAVFLCGAVVMVLELTGSRVLAPYLGTSIVVWTSLIGVVLGALSLGYWWGGRLADRRPEPRLLSRLILYAALATLLLAGTKGLLLHFLQNRTAWGLPELPLPMAGVTLLATAILFGPASVLLGMVSPFAVRLRLESAASSGRTAGNLYALSTLGSITGTFAAGFWLTATLGTTNIILCMAGVLVVASACVYRGDVVARLAALALVGLAAVTLAAWDGQLRRIGLFDLDTGYQRVLVFNTTDERSGKEMRVMTTGPEGVQSALYPADPQALAVAYTRFYRLAGHFRPDVRRMLMLGGGGYSFPKYVLSQPQEFGGRPHMDVVEIDPGVTAISRRYFQWTGHPDVRVFHDDARRFLAREGARAQPGAEPYQVALMDVFTSHYSVPFHLATRETLTALSSLLDADGVVLVNCISAAEGPRSRFYRALLATYASVFPRVESFLVLHPDDPAAFQNILLVAFKSPAAPALTSPKADLQAMLDARFEPGPPRPGDPPALTDDFAPVEHYLLSL